MTEPRQALEPLDLLWSLWTELGVPGPFRRHREVVIDPELLVLVTPWLARQDRRLQDLAFSWVLAHGPRLSLPRLSGLAETLGPEVRSEAQGFLSAWPGGGTRWTHRQPGPSAGNDSLGPRDGDPLGPQVLRDGPPARRSGVPQVAQESGLVGWNVAPVVRDIRPVTVDLRRPALWRLRLRALIGVGGRADVVAALIAQPDRWLTARELDDVGLSKRNVAELLGDLVSGGFVLQRPRANAIEHQWRDPAGLAAATDLGALRFPDWRAVFDWMLHWDALSHIPSTRPTTRLVELARRRDALDALARRLDLPELGPVDGLQEEVVRHGQALVDGTSPAFAF